MIFKQENVQDIARYYKNTYIKLRETGDVLYYIRNVEHSRVIGTDQDGNEFELWLDDEFPYEVDYILPNKSVFQYGSFAMMLQRTPAKQYQRGISAGNTVVQRLGSQGNWQTQDFGFEVLKAFVTKQKYLTLSEAMQNPKGLSSIALSNRFSFLPRGKVILCDQVPVAKLVQGKFQVLQPVFMNDVLEIVQGSRWGVK